MRSTAGALEVVKSAKILALLLTAALLFGGAAVGLVNVQASANGKYDTDGDGLIEVNNLEQLSAIRYDLDGDGTAESDDSAEAYARAFTTSGTEVVCAGNCAGYELFRPLDFDEADSYASGIVNTVLITGAGWLPIGTRTHGFNTTFDGNGHTISNLFIDRTGRLNDPGAVGLFGSIGRSGVIREIGLAGVDLTGQQHVGGLAGYNEGAISASHATGAVTGSSSVGGLAGYNESSGTIGDSHATGSVTGGYDIGGLVGDNGGAIGDSYATGAVTGIGYVGGLAGGNYDHGTISASYATGSVSGEGKSVGGLVGNNGGAINASHATGAVTGSSYYVGGLAGFNYGAISDSYATGSVSGAVEEVGGLAGRNEGRISGSYATGAVIGGHYGIGGLAGSSRGIISASYATGSVSGEDESVGGLAGISSGAISASYATGAVTGRSGVGGLAGDNHGAISASYATGTVSGEVGKVGGLAGYNGGRISAGYASGTVSGPWNVGGLIGQNTGEHLVGASYAVGKVSGNDNVGGLIGSDSGYVIAGFWDNQTSGQGTGVGDGDPIVVVGKTTAELQGPTGYTGIYTAWLIDLDNADGDLDFQTGIDEFWNFGTGSQYPALIVDFDGDGTPTWQEFGSQRRAPTGLTATASGETRIDLSWRAPTDTGGNPVTGYKIEYSANGNEPWTEVETTGNAGTNYSDTGLTAGTTRYYRVSAVTSAGPGTPSNVARATTIAAPVNPPGPPTGLTAEVSEDEAKVDLSWTAPAFTGGAPITGYRIESSADGNEPWTEVITTTGDGTTYKDDGTDANGPMFSAGNWPYYRVAAVNRVGIGPFSDLRYPGGDPLIARYDANGNGTIERSEVIAAINDYLFGRGDEAFSKAEVIKLINLYLFG